MDMANMAYIMSPSMTPMQVQMAMLCMRCQCSHEHVSILLQLGQGTSSTFFGEPPVAAFS